MCHDTAWCLCAVKPRQSCPPNWRVVPVELSALFVTTIAFVLNLLAAVLSMKMWKTASARLERIRSSMQRKKRSKLDVGGEPSTANVRREIERKSLRSLLVDDGDQRNRDFRFLFVGAAAATAASAAAAPMFSASKTVVDHLNRPRTLLYPEKNEENEEQEDVDCVLHWWKSPENFV